MLSEASQAPSDGPRPSRTSARSLNCVMAPAITKAPDRKPTVGKTSVRGRSGERLLIHTVWPPPNIPQVYMPVLTLCPYI